MSAKVKSRLGRGLSSLISMSIDSEAAAAASPAGDVATTVAAATAQGDVAISDVGHMADTTPAEIAVELVDPNPHQPRRHFDDALLAQLAQSLKSSGLIQPIVVRQQGDRFELIAGERRLRAAKLAGLVRIPAIVRQVDAFAQAQMALVENIQRADLNPIDRAAAYRTLLDQLGLTQAELAQRLGEERSSIANFLRLNELAEPVRALVREDRLSLGHAKLLAGIDDVLEQARLAQLVVNQELSVRNLERLIAEPTVTAPAKVTASGDAYISELEKNISRQLGMRVQVKRTGAKGKGRLVVHYGSLDQFDQIVSRLGIQLD